MDRAPYYILDDDGNPHACEDVLTWAAWFERATADRTRIVKQDYAEGSAGSVGVSTIFLGLDHNFFNGADPVLWESMIFGTAFDGEQRRYTSKADAIRGHEALVAKVQQWWIESGGASPSADDVDPAPPAPSVRRDRRTRSR